MRLPGSQASSAAGGPPAAAARNGAVHDTTRRFWRGTVSKQGSWRGIGTPAIRHKRDSWLVRLLRWQRREWTDDRELAHAVHGTVVGAAAMAAASLHGSLGEVVTTVLVTNLVYWAAERYARVLSVAVHGPHRTARALAALRRGWPMLQAAYTPLVVLVVAEAVTGNLRTGVLAALTVATLLLGGLGHAAARRAGSSHAGAIGWGAVSGGLGVVVILMKLLLH
jgi:hypothetical protein